MAALDFPTTPTVGALYPPTVVPGIPQYQWDGTAWRAIATPEALTYVRRGGDTMTGRLTLPDDPTADLHAVTKRYVDGGIGGSSAGKVSRAGDTMTGLLTLSADPTVPLHAATKQYVDRGSRGYLYGLTIGWLNATSISVSPGEATSDDPTNPALMKLASTINKNNAAWVQGHGGGAWDTGPATLDAVWSFFLIYNPTSGVTDVLMSLSATAPTLPAGYTHKRRIGSMMTLTSYSGMIRFQQHGDQFYYSAHLIYSNPAPFGPTAIGVYCPIGVITLPVLTLSIQQDPSGGSSGGYLFPGGNSNVQQYVIASNLALDRNVILLVGPPTDLADTIILQTTGGMTDFTIYQQGHVDFRGRLF